MPKPFTILYIILLIFSSISVLFAYDRSFQSYNNQLLTTDCYETFSFPKQYVQISHYFPIGPLYLFVKFEYKLYSFIFGHIPKIITVSYHFKRVNRKCISSIYFTSIGKDFKKLIIKIRFYLFEKEFEISLISYTFIPGFHPNTIKLWDARRYFCLIIKVLDITQEYYLAENSSWFEAKYYLNLINKKYGDICLITENNREVVLRVNHRLNSFNYLTTRFITEVLYHGRVIYSYKFPSFECFTNQSFRYEKNILIYDIMNFNDIQFGILFRILDRKHELIYKGKLHLYNINFKYIKNIDLNKNFNKIFLLHQERALMNCNDGTNRTIFKSNDGIAYYAREYKAIQYSFGIETHQFIPHLLSNPCAE